MSAKKQKVITEIIKLLIIILIPLISIEYIIYLNIIPHDFDYFYDIGVKDYLSPQERISEKINNSELSYQNLTSQLVYFDIPASEDTSQINLSIRFKDNFPEDSRFLLGAKDKEEWSYNYKTIYDKTIESLIEKYPYEVEDGLIFIKLNPNAKDYSIKEIQDSFPKGTLATDLNIEKPEFSIKDYTPSDLTINEALRDSLTFYVYVKGDFSVKVWKRDLNWYNEEDKGEDILEILLYDLEDNLISKEIIKDDGEDDKEIDKNNTEDQSKELKVFDLEEGVYKLVLKNNGDMVIPKIKFNQNKVILKGPVFLAQSNIYFNDFEDESKIYFQITKPTEVSIKTWHKEGVQTLTIGDKEIEIEEPNSEESKLFYFSSDLYQLKSKKNDIKISGPLFFSFTRDSWFNPFESNKINYKSDTDYLLDKADYVFTEYTPVDTKENWKIISTSFDVEGDNLYIKEDKLNMIFNIPHLQNEKDTSSIQIPIDWINITVHKKGLFEK